MTNKELTQKMFDLIESNVPNAFDRDEMFNLLEELEDRL